MKHPLLKDKSIQYEAKLCKNHNIHQLLLTVLTHGHRIREVEQGAEMKFLRSSVRNSRKDRVKNGNARRNLGVKSSREQVERSTLTWFGHV